MGPTSLGRWVVCGKCMLWLNCTRVWGGGVAGQQASYLGRWGVVVGAHGHAYTVACECVVSRGVVYTGYTLLCLSFAFAFMTFRMRPSACQLATLSYVVVPLRHTTYWHAYSVVVPALAPASRRALLFWRCNSGMQSRSHHRFCICAG